MTAPTNAPSSTGGKNGIALDVPGRTPAAGASSADSLRAPVPSTGAPQSKPAVTAIPVWSTALTSGRKAGDPGDSLRMANPSSPSAPSTGGKGDASLRVPDFSPGGKEQGEVNRSGLKIIPVTTGGRTTNSLSSPLGVPVPGGTNRPSATTDPSAPIPIDPLVQEGRGSTSWREQQLAKQAAEAKARAEEQEKLRGALHRFLFKDDAAPPQ